MDSWIESRCLVYRLCSRRNSDSYSGEYICILEHVVSFDDEAVLHPKELQTRIAVGE
jgi:hypothetical protein